MKKKLSLLPMMWINYGDKKKATGSKDLGCSGLKKETPTQDSSTNLLSREEEEIRLSLLRMPKGIGSKIHSW